MSFEKTWHDLGPKFRFGVKNYRVWVLESPVADPEQPTSVLSENSEKRENIIGEVSLSERILRAHRLGGPQTLEVKLNMRKSANASPLMARATDCALSFDGKVSGQSRYGLLQIGNLPSARV